MKIMKSLPFRLVMGIVLGMLLGLIRDGLRAGCHLKDIIETKVDQGGQDDIDIIQIIELGVQGRGRQRNSIFVFVQDIQPVRLCFLCVMRAGPHTLSAVNAELAGNACLAVPDPDRLRRTAFDAVNASLAQILFKIHRVEKFIRHMVTFFVIVFRVFVSAQQSCRMHAFLPG